MSKLGKDITINVLFAVINIGSIWVLTRLSTGMLVPVALALFMLVRRYSASLVGLFCLGGPAFQVRYLGMHGSDERLCQLIDLLVVAAYVATSTLLIAIVAVAAPWLNAVFFPAESYPGWVIWYVAFLSIQQLFHFVVINHLLVLRRMVLYNIYKLLCSSGFYLVVLLFAGHESVKRILEWYLLASFVLLVAGHAYFTLRPLLQARHLPLHRARWLSKEGLVYGPPRSVINFMDSLMFVIGPWLVRNDVKEVAYLLTMFVFVQATGIVVLPINELSMVLGASYVGRSESGKLEAGTRALAEAALAVSLIIVAAIYPYRSALLKLAIGNDDILRGVARYSLLLTCIIPLTVYNAIKGVIEVTWTAPKNLVNLIASNALGVATFYCLKHGGYAGSVAILWSSMATFWSLGVFTLLAASKLIKDAAWAHLLTLAGLSAVVLGANWLCMHVFFHFALPVLFQLTLMAASAVVLVILWWYTTKPALLRFAVDYLRRAFAARGLASSGALGGDT